VVKVMILRGPGTNCDIETSFAVEKAGGMPESIYIKRWIEKPDLIKDYQMLIIPGGFTYGDDLGAGKVMAFEIENFLFEELNTFVENGNLILGICNGFQILVKSGILPFRDKKQYLSLAMNKKGLFKDQWVKLRVETNKSVFLKDIAYIDLPIANAEGRIVTDEKISEILWNDSLVALTYEGANPSDSQDRIAGIIDKTGRILGLMPHPERNIFPHHHPGYKRGILGGKGLKIFQNSVAYFR